jgi:hypothetical protein
MNVVVDGVLLLDPTSTQTRERTELAPRLTTLDGVRFGLLANGKHHGALLLDLIVDELGTRYDLGEPLRITKAHPSQPPTDEQVAMLSAHSLAVLSAIGD